MIAFVMMMLLLAPSEAAQKVEISTAMDVPAVRYTTPPSHPCNVTPEGADGFVEAVCITRNETHWKCSDSARVLLSSEDGVKHCILFPAQAPETVTIHAGGK